MRSGSNGDIITSTFYVFTRNELSIYILRALTSKSAQPDAAADPAAEAIDIKKDPSAKHESAMDLMKDREKKDFLETDDSYTISNDL